MWCFRRRLPCHRGGAEGDVPEELMTLDCLFNIDLKDNRLTGERGECAFDSA